MSNGAVNEIVPDPADGQRPMALAVENPFYIQAAAPVAAEHDRVLKEGETFAIFDDHGDIRPVGLCEEGLFHDGTRYLSAWLLKLGRERPLFLSSTVKEDNALMTADLTNPDVRDGELLTLPRGTLHLFRAKFLWQWVCYERLRVRNYGPAPVRTSFALHFAADFADIFEVR